MLHNLFWDHANYERMAKTVDWSIQNGASSICFFVKWLLLLRVTFQACKSSIFPPQHHTLESSTLWAFSLVVRCRTHRKTRPVPRKIPKNITKAVGSSCSVAISKFRLPLTSIIYRKFDYNTWSNKQQIVPHVVLFHITTGHPRLMVMPADNFFPFPRSFNLYPSDCQLKAFKPNTRGRNLLGRGSTG